MYRRVQAALTLVGVLAVFPRPANAGPKEDAKRFYLEAQAQWEAGNLEVAAERFLQSYRLYPSPAIALGLARALRASGKYEDALHYYQLYDREKENLPPHLPRIDVSGEMTDTRALIDGERAPATPAPPTESASPVAASRDELARLQALASELSALASRLATAPEEAPPADSVVASPPVDTTPPPEAGVGLDQFDLFEEETRSVSRYGQPLLEAPATVSILTADDIRLSGATNIPEVLRRVVGVDVMEMSAAQPDVSIRGFNRALSNKVLVLVDGRAVYQDILATPLWAAIPVTLEEIERIEVVRGPASAVYGANAFNGVVNIITRAPGQGKDLVHFEAGSPDHARGVAIVSGRHGNTSARMSAGYHQTGRWSAEAPVVDGGPHIPYFEDQAKSLGIVIANARLDHRIADDANISLSGGYSGGTSEFYVFGRLGDYALDLDSAYGRADIGVGRVHVRTYVNTLNAETGPWTSLAGARSLDTFVNSLTVDGESEFIEEIEGNNVEHHIVAGAGYRFKSIEWGYLLDGGGPIHENHYRVYVQEEAALGAVTDGGWRPFRLVASLRYDKHPNVSNPLQTLSPRGAAVWRVADGRSFRLSGGTAFRAPSLMESYLELYQPVSGADAVNVLTLGNTALAPERLLSVEAGVHDESTTRHAADLTVYANQVKGLMGLSDVDPGGRSELLPDQTSFTAGTTNFINESELYRGYGLEGDLRLFPVTGLDLYANLSLGRVFVGSVGSGIPEESMSTVKANVGALVRTPYRTDFGLHVHYLSPQTWRERDFDDNGEVQATALGIPGRTLLVTRIATRPFPAHDLEFGFSGWNLLAMGGHGFQEHPLGQTLGPRLLGTATWRY